MSWHPAPDALINLIEEDIEVPLSDVRYMRLPFYADGYLVEFNTQFGTMHMVLGGQGGLHTALLTGSSEQLRIANRIGGVKLTRESVADYVRFFCNNLAASNRKAFEVVESASGRKLESGHRLRDMRVRVRHQEDDGSFRIGAYQLHDEELYRVSLRISLNGKVDMLRSLELGPFIKVTH